MSWARLSARDVALVAAFAALIAALGVPGGIPLPFSPVPITLQTLGVMLAGLILGPARGAAAVLTLLALVALGFPLLAGGRGGLAPFQGPSAGYLLGWIVGAAVTGLLARGALRSAAAGTHRTRATAQMMVAAFIGGIVVVHAIGVPVLAWRAGLDLSKAVLIDLAFVPGDILKAVFAAMVAATVARAYPPVAQPQRHGDAVGIAH